MDDASVQNVAGRDRSPADDGGFDRDNTSPGGDVILWERVDTRTGIIDRIRIPVGMLWTRPMSKSVIAAKLNIDRKTLSAWIADGRIDAEPCGSMWRVRPGIFGGRDQLEALVLAVVDPE